MQGRHIENQGCEIYFVRHAQSTANTGVVRVDSPLSAVGIEQAKSLE